MHETESNSPIGVFDSGLGGLTVLKSCISKLPSERFVYLGDTARTPYGSKDSDTIKRYSRECAEFLVSQGVKLVVVACNTSSAYALGELSEIVSCPIIGTVEPAVARAIETSKSEKVGVIGTEATVSCGVYESNLRAIKPSLEVTSIACPLFVPLVEQGMFDGEIVDKIVELYLAPLKMEKIDTLILGCTHYPLLADSIQKFMGKGVQLIACSEAIADAAESSLTNRKLLNPSNSFGEVKYFVTDAVQRFNCLGAALLDIEEIRAKKIHIPFT